MPIVAAVAYAIHTDIPGFEDACQKAFSGAVLQANSEGISVEETDQIRARTKAAVNKVRVEFGLEPF